MAEEEKLESQEPENQNRDEDLAAQWASMLENQPEKKNDEDLASQWASMIEDQQDQKVEQETPTTVKEESVKVDPKISQKLQLILDIPVSITFEIGSRKMTIEEITKLSPSSIVELDKYIDQPIDIKVNGVLVAKGELYQVEDNFAVKITQIVSREERLKLLTMIGG
ncbi:MAG: flagellar motor switch protein FliN [Hydrogenothermaceae bacterium]|nr:flagellar motor switch protein FliN [Hydrogenothermaceae bacterium]